MNINPSPTQTAPTRAYQQYEQAVAAYRQVKEAVSPSVSKSVPQSLYLQYMAMVEHGSPSQVRIFFDRLERYIKTQIAPAYGASNPFVRGLNASMLKNAVVNSAVALGRSGLPRAERVADQISALYFVLVYGIE